MKKFESFFAEPKKECPTINRVWYAYKHGESRMFVSEREAKTFSKMFEVSNDPESVKQHQVICEFNTTIESEAFIAWYQYLKNDVFSTISDKVFEVIYNRAYDEKHSSGYDAVAERMNEIYSFVMDIINAYRDEK